MWVTGNMCHPERFRDEFIIKRYTDIFNKKQKGPRPLTLQYSYRTQINSIHGY